MTLARTLVLLLLCAPQVNSRVARGGRAARREMAAAAARQQSEAMPAPAPVRTKTPGPFEALKLVLPVPPEMAPRSEPSPDRAPQAKAPARRRAADTEPKLVDGAPIEDVEARARLYMEADAEPMPAYGDDLEEYVEAGEIDPRVFEELTHKAREQGRAERRPSPPTEIIEAVISSSVALGKDVAGSTFDVCKAVGETGFDITHTIGKAVVGSSYSISKSVLGGGYKISSSVGKGIFTITKSVCAGSGTILKTVGRGVGKAFRHPVKTGVLLAACTPQCRKELAYSCRKIGESRALGRLRGDWPRRSSGRARARKSKR